MKTSRQNAINNHFAGMTQDKIAMIDSIVYNQPIAKHTCVVLLRLPTGRRVVLVNTSDKQLLDACAIGCSVVAMRVGR